MDNATQRERTPAQKWRESEAIEDEVRRNLDSGQRTDEKVADLTGIGAKDTYRKLDAVMQAAEEGDIYSGW